MLYHAPLPNVYNDGKLCFGTNTPPDLNRGEEVGKSTAQLLQEAWEMFIGSPFNGHLAQDKSKTHPTDVREQLVALGDCSNTRATGNSYLTIININNNNNNRRVVGTATRRESWRYRGKSDR